MQVCHHVNGVRVCSTNVCHLIIQYVLHNLTQGAAYENVPLVSPFNYMEMS